MVAELVLQALDVKRVAACRRAGCAASGSTTGRRLSARARGRSRTSAPSRTTCARRARTRRPAPPPFSGVRDGGVRAHVRAALLLGHRHARRSPQPFSPAGIRRGSYVRGRHQRLPLGRQLRLRAQRGHDREGHRDRAANPASACIAVMYSAARAVCANGSSLVHGSECSSCSTPMLHQLVPRRVELDLVDAVARSGRTCAARACSRWPGDPTPAEARRPRRRSARAPTPARDPAGALALHRLHQRQVAREHVNVPPAAAPG